MGAYDCDCMNNLEYDRREKKAQLSQEGTTKDATSDLIERQAALKALRKCQTYLYDARDPELKIELSSAEAAINNLPPAQPERDIPKKPIATTDRAWGIPLRQAVCPECDCYLGHAFLGDYRGKRITYCENCGQAIDWEGWDFDE